MTLIPHSLEWYARLATLQQGYSYPWHSVRQPWNGEDIFPKMVFEHLRPELDVLEIGCAQGELALAMAPGCRSVLAYDAIPEYIGLARQAQAGRGASNVRFLVHNSSLDANGGRARLPAADQSIDLFVSSKGPWHWIADAPRAGRPGAVLLMLIPDTTPETPWMGLLPEVLRWEEGDPHWARTSIERRLDEAGLRLHSWWSFDVPDLFPNPKELVAWRTFGFAAGEAPAYSEVARQVEQIFQDFAGPQGLEVRWRRHIWKAVIPR